MNTDRDELIDAMARALCDVQKYPTGPHDVDRFVVRPLLDALLAHPGVVLRELESAKCETCGGRGKVKNDYKAQPHTNSADMRCSACGGSGILGRDGVLKLLGWDLDALAGHLDACLDSLGHTDVSSREWLAEFVAPEPCGVCGVTAGQHRRLRPASRMVRDELLDVMARARDAHDGDDYDGAVLDALLDAGVLKRIGVESGGYVFVGKAPVFRVSVPSTPEES